MWALVVAGTMAAGCGRVGYDPIASTGDDPVSDGGATGDGVAVGCDVSGDSRCTGIMNSISSVGSGSFGNTTGMFANVLQGSCGGSAAGEYRVGLIPLDDARVQFTVSASFDTVLYVLQGDCDGVEIACQDVPAASGETVEVAVSAGEMILVVADGQNACGPVSIDWVGMNASVQDRRLSAEAGRKPNGSR